MRLLHKLRQTLRLLYDKDFRFLFLSDRGYFDHKMDDVTYIKRKYKAKFKRDLNLENPLSYNEKLQWLKIYNRKNEYTLMVDKYLVKNYVSELIGNEYIIPTLGVWDRFEDINFNNLPNNFVLKCTHDSGGIVICKDKNNLNLNRTRRKLNKCLKRNFYYKSREWPYKNVKPRIIAEKYMYDKERPESSLDDYKFYCFDGKVKFSMIVFDRFSSKKTKSAYFDRNFNKIDIKWGHDKIEGDIKKPAQYEKMIELAEVLSVGIPHVRVDFYVVNNNIYFGELTFFDGGGFDVIEPYEKDLEIGSYLNLPNKSIN